MRHLFVSPHFDDAVGSCGGMIARFARMGEGVTILTMFGGDGPPAPSDFARHLHRLGGLADATAVETRRAEDAAAAARLGVVAVSAELPEAIYRQDEAGGWRYPDSRSLFGNAHPADRALVGIVARLIVDRAGPPGGGTTVHVPLAIGRHIDHRLVLAAGYRLADAGWTVDLFEDFWWRDRAPPPAPEGCRRTAVVFSFADLAAKIDALAAYRSQIGGLYGSVEAMTRRLTDDARRDGGGDYGEILWVPAA